MIKTTNKKFEYKSVTLSLKNQIVLMSLIISNA